MRRLRERAASAVTVAVLACGAAAEDLAVFLDRHDLRSTRVQWMLQRLRLGGAAARDAAKALASDGAWMTSEGALEPAERRQVLTDVVAALPPGDRAAARPRLELAGRETARVAAEIDALRGRTAAPDRLRAAMQALEQAGDILKPLLADEPRRGADPLGEWRAPARLLDGWCRLMQVWLMRRIEGVPSRKSALELTRAQVVLARLLDADDRSPLPVNASADLLRTENGAEAALAMVVATAMQGDAPASAAWQQALREQAPGSRAAQRLPAWRVALAVDAGDAAALRRAVEQLGSRPLSGELALAAATVASERGGADAEVVVAAALESMPAEARAEWLHRLATGSGRLRPLAEAVERGAALLPAWQRGGDEGAAEAAAALQAALKDTRDSPAALQAEALRLLAWSTWRAGRGQVASEVFERAAETGPAFRAECLWLAAIASPAIEGPALARRLDLLRAQRAADPQGPFAGRVTTWLSRLDGFPNSATAVAALMEVPLDDAFVADARCEAARRLLLQAGSDADARTEAARRALRVIEPVRQAPQAARWMLIAALTPGVQDGRAAAEAVAALQPSDRSDPAVAAALARWAALRGDVEGVREAAAAVAEPARCVTALRAAAALAEVDGAPARAAQLELSIEASRAADVAVRSAAADLLARATLEMAEQGHAWPDGRAGEVVAVLRQAPASSLQPLALAEALRAAGEIDEAITLLQQRSGASPQGSATWLQARWLLLRALETADRERARAMLAQHLALLPDGGAEPWGERFRQAARRLEVRP